MKIPHGFKPKIIDSEVVFQTKPRMFGWSWWTIPSLFIRYYVKPGKIFAKEKKGGKPEIVVGSKDANLSATVESSSWKTWLFESMFDQRDITFRLDEQMLKWKNVRNAENVREFVKKVAKGEYPIPSREELGLQKNILMRVKLDFSQDKNSQYSRFISSQEEMEKTPIEQMLHNSDEVLSFVQSHADEPESRLLLDWLVEFYLGQLRIIKQDSLNDHSDPDTWTLGSSSQRGEASPQEKEIYKGKVYAFRESATRERFDALYENAREAQANSLWVDEDGLWDIAKGVVLIGINKVKGK